MTPTGSETSVEAPGPPRVEEVSEDVFAHLQPDGTWFLNNSGFLVGSEGVVCIDSCATERRTRALLAAIRERSDRPVHTLVNTHHHGDHTYGNHLFRPAAIVGHELCREEIIRQGRPKGGFVETVDWGHIEIAPPTTTFSHRLALHVGDLPVELHHVGVTAHTTNDVVAWVPARGVLFAGDLVFNGGMPFALAGSIRGWLEAIATLRAFGASTIVPGHGAVSGPEVLDPLERYLRFVQEAARSGAEAGLEPLELARELDLGEFGEMLDPERIVGNLHRAYAELPAAGSDQPLSVERALQDMIAYNGGRPLRCHA